jgi:hypothetical protein
MSGTLLEIESALLNGPSRTRFPEPEAEYFSLRQFHYAHSVAI